MTHFSGYLDVLDVYILPWLVLFCREKVPLWPGGNVYFFGGGAVCALSATTEVPYSPFISKKKTSLN